jgi:hypothetical protein
MNPCELRSKRRTRFFLIITAVALATSGVCAFLRITRPPDLEAYFGMASECDPVWKQFALRRFGAGDLADELFRRFPPTLRREFGRYGVYSYGFGFTGLSVVTRDGKLLSARAGSCDWQFTFFSNEDRELNRQYESYLRQKYPDAFVVQTNSPYGQKILGGGA